MLEARLGVGVVGLGRWGSKIARTLTRLPEARIAALCDLDFAAPALKTAWPGYRQHTRLEALLEDPEIEALLIATPPQQHCSMALRALRAGKHVFVEKPMALSIVEAEQLATCARSSDRVLMVGHLMHYHPAIELLFALVAEGETGVPLAFFSERSNVSPVLRGDAWWALGPHDVSLALRAFDADPKYVSARATGSAVNAVLQFPSGRATLRVAHSGSKRTRRLAVVGTRRSIFFEDDSHEPRLTLAETTEAQLARVMDTKPDWSWEELFSEAPRTEPLIVSHKEPLLAELEHFVACSRHGKRPLTDANEGLAVTRILIAGQCSLENGSHRVLLTAGRSRERWSWVAEGAPAEPS